MLRERVLSVTDRHAFQPAETAGLEAPALLDPPLATGRLDAARPVHQGRVRAGLGNEQEVGFKSPDRLAKRLVGIEIIAQVDRLRAGQARAMAGQPAPHRAALAVLLFRSVLGRDELRRQGQRAIVARRHQDPAEHLMIELPASGPGLSASIAPLALGALGAGDLERAMVLGPIQGDQNTPVKALEIPKTSARPERFERAREHPIKGHRRHWTA